MSAPPFEPWCIIPFPLARRDGARTRSFQKPVAIAPAVIERLSSDELFTYMRLALWFERGEAANLVRLADECFCGDLETADYWIGALTDVGLVQDAAEYAAARHAEMEQRRVEAQARAAAAAAHVVAYLDGRWQGQWPLTLRQDFPLFGVPVVYFMYDSKDRLAYVGSSKQFRKRMEQHAETPRCKPWARWEARECGSRLDAYTLETNEINSRRPYQNKVSTARGADFVRSAKRGAQ